MIARIKTSWMLLDRSLSVLIANKKLLVFPLVTLAATVVIALFFLGSFLFQPTGHGYKEPEHWKAIGASLFTEDSMKEIARNTRVVAPGAPHRRAQLKLNSAGMLWIALAYFLSMFVATFFNVAFYHEIIEALNDRPVGISQGVAFALSRVGPILGWSVFAGLIGYAIKMMEQRLGLLGRITARIIGLAWSLAAVFAIPVIICEQDASNPFTVLKTSAQALKKTWGETLVGFLGFQGVSLLVIFGSLLPFSAALCAGVFMKNGGLVAGAFVAWFLFIFLFSYVAGVAGSVYQCALYLFASRGAVPDGFSAELMNAGWKHKKA